MTDGHCINVADLLIVRTRLGKGTGCGGQP